MSYSAAARPPRTLTDREVAKLLKVTGEHRAGFRDHVIYSLALGCALRESEIVALNIGDVSPDGVRVKRVIQLREFKRAGAGADPHDQRVHVPDATYHKLVKYLKLRTKIPSDHSAPIVGLEDPLFPSRQKRRSSGRLSTRRVREAFGIWQRRAGFDHVYNFHTLRHTAITNVRRATGDIRIAQRFGRHVNIGTTVRYEHASDEELAAAVKKIPA